MAVQRAWSSAGGAYGVEPGPAAGTHFAPWFNCCLKPCREVLAGTVVAGQIKDTKAAREVQALQDFMTMLGQVRCA